MTANLKTWCLTLLTLNHGVAVHGTNWSGITMLAVQHTATRTLATEGWKGTAKLFALERPLITGEGIAGGLCTLLSVTNKSPI